MNINLTLIGQSITFFVFIVFCWKYVWPALLSVMQAREQRIEEGLQAANRADKDLELAKKESVERLKEAKAQAAAILDQANQRANQLVDEAKEQAKIEADRIITAAKAEVDAELSQAREALRGEVAALAITGAEKVLGETIDAKKHAAMLDKLAANL